MEIGDMFCGCSVMLVILSIVYFVTPVVARWADEAERDGAYKRRRD